MSCGGYLMDFENEINQASTFLGMSPDQFLVDIGLLQKAKKDTKLPGVSSKTDPNVARGFSEFGDYYRSTKGVHEQLPSIPNHILRETERKNPVLGACTVLRLRQIRQFCMIAKDEDTPGFRIMLEDSEKKPTAIEKKEMQSISKWFTTTGRTDFDGWDDREDSLHDVMSKMVREMMIIDQVAIEIRRDHKGDIVDFFVRDAATIRKVTEGGFLGEKGDINPASAMLAGDNYYDQLVRAKVQIIPEKKDIRYVQELQGRYVAAFTRKDLIFSTFNKRADIQHSHYGYSLVEQSVAAITAFMYALAYNASQFNQGTMPKIALSFEEDQFSREELITLQDEWLANFQGLHGAWRIPILNGKVKVIDLLKSPRDMEFMKYMEFAGALICAVMGVDPAEIGLRFAQAQNVMTENSEAKLMFSKDRGLHDLLHGIEDVFNKIMRLAGWSDKYVFKFAGISPQNKEVNSKLRKEAVETYKTVNEIRAEEDLSPIEGGDILLSTVFMQKQQPQGEEEGGGFEGEEDYGNFDTDFNEEFSDDEFEDVFKTTKVKRIRTLLK